MVRLTTYVRCPPRGTCRPVLEAFLLLTDERGALVELLECC